MSSPEGRPIRVFGGREQDVAPWAPDRRRDRPEQTPPDIYVHPEIVDIGAFDFTAIEDLFDQAAPAVARFKEQLSTVLEG